MKTNDCRQSGQVRRADGAVDKPTTSPQSDLYSEGWDRIFGCIKQLDLTKPITKDDQIPKGNS